MPDATSCLTPPATTEIGLIRHKFPNSRQLNRADLMNMIQCTPGLVADVRSADTPEEASSSSKTIRKGAEREAHFTKHKRTAYKVFEIVLENKLMDNEDDFEGLEEEMWFLHECRKSENAIASENVRQSKETLARIQKTLKNLSELIEKHKQVHKETLDDFAQILVDGKEKLKQEEIQTEGKGRHIEGKRAPARCKNQFPSSRSYNS